MFTGSSEDDLVQLAVGQCPRKCIYYVTPSQRTILEDILARYISIFKSYSYRTKLKPVKEITFKISQFESFIGAQNNSDQYELVSNY